MEKDSLCQGDFSMAYHSEKLSKSLEKFLMWTKQTAKHKNKIEGT